ncbi:hypothetical protein KF282_2114 [Lactococcus lactis subsp. lactis]|uniref:Uncharacterized protein n=1 Tax=Lactococcus lactis subsp. lactis TaxID=1360 RepID=A0A0V8CNI8_LACLL|nr:hypothetical protein KF282_2114 [Lactococcus lactis subsp. lactis]
MYIININFSLKRQQLAGIIYSIFTVVNLQQTKNKYNNML